MSARLPIAFVVQRFGQGGAELHCQWVAEHLAHRYDVTILTTCANDHTTWANHFRPGETVHNGVKVRRFRTTRTRPPDFVEYSNRVFDGPRTRADELAWLEAQGPHSPDLLAAIERERDRFAVIFFFTYLYEPTVLGLPLAGGRAALVPTAHDEAPIRLSIYRDVFHAPHWIVWNSPWERRFIQEMFHNEHIPGAVAGCGIDPPPPGDALAFRRRYGVEGDVLAYVGRVEGAKGVGELVEWSQRYQRRRPFTLALVGTNVMELPRSPGILPLGYLSDQEKADVLAAATAFVMPSAHESLSMVTLEAWLADRPVLANGRAEVIREHIELSQGGLYYDGPLEFVGCLEWLLDHPVERARMAANGRRYVETNYSWPRIEAIYDRAIAEVAGGAAPV